MMAIIIIIIIMQTDTNNTIWPHITTLYFSADMLALDIMLYVIKLQIKEIIHYQYRQNCRKWPLLPFTGELAPPPLHPISPLQPSQQPTHPNLLVLPILYYFPLKRTKRNCSFPVVNSVVQTYWKACVSFFLHISEANVIFNLKEREEQRAAWFSQRANGVLRHIGDIPTL